MAATAETVETSTDAVTFVEVVDTASPSMQISVCASAVTMTSSVSMVTSTTSSVWLSTGAGMGTSISSSSLSCSRRSVTSQAPSSSNFTLMASSSVFSMISFMYASTKRSCGISFKLQTGQYHLLLKACILEFAARYMGRSKHWRCLHFKPRTGVFKRSRVSGHVSQHLFSDPAAWTSSPVLSTSEDQTMPLTLDLQSFAVNGCL
mmetsp:Transcript_93002/g.194366  ORF Transcript_93002/g.194366 Transcript_93002/m.194366 type:complete len:205 (-) Transcript_93002:368-982(-)